MGMDSITEKQLHLDGHGQVNVTWGLDLVVHVELDLWITDTVCRIYQILLALIPSFISINVYLQN